MSIDEDNKDIPWRIVRWLEKYRFSKKEYEDLSDICKTILHNLICLPACTTTANERKKLYKELFCPDVGGRESVDPTDFVPDEEIRKILCLLTNESLSDLEKF